MLAQQPGRHLGQDLPTQPSGVLAAQLPLCVQFFQAGLLYFSWVISQASWVDAPKPLSLYGQAESSVQSIDVTLTPPVSAFPSLPKAS